jgi:hypothetical protein
MACPLFALLVGAAKSDNAASSRSRPDWLQVLRESRVTLPPPQEKVVWREDLSSAMREATLTGRPLFVTMRCLPCKQCSAFDKDVLEGGPELEPLLKQFVTVRLTDVQNVDLRIFPMQGFQDFDLSWWGWFLSPQAQVYGVFGGRDHVSDATRISVPALANTLRRVLAHHYDPRRAEWNIDGPMPAFAGKTETQHTPKGLPGYASWKAKTHEEVQKQACIHCHQVADILRQPAVDTKTFDKVRGWQMWPLPENVGIVADRDHGLKVTSVSKETPAEAAGLRPGDELAAAGGRRLFSQADFRGVLHRGPSGAGAIDVHWLRDGKVMSAGLKLADGWREPGKELDWRMSTSQGNVGAYPHFFPINSSAKERKERGIPEGTMAAKPFFGPNTDSAAYKAGMRPNQLIVAVGDESPDLTGRALLVWFRKRYDPGDTVTFTVVDDKGQRRKISYKLAGDEQ